MQHDFSPIDTSAVPPIVLLVEDDADTREMYSLYFESAGMWVAGAPHPGAAMQAVHELKPDLVVTDIGFDGQALGIQFVDTMKKNEATAHVPIILLTGRSMDAIPAETRAQADLCLLKPVFPTELVSQADLVLKRSRALRARIDVALHKAGELRERSQALMARSRAIDERVNLTLRSCPGCGEPLHWIETGTIDGREFDYFHWCSNKCGLHCFDRDGRRWVKLAG